MAYHGIDGLDVWTNAKNGFTVARVHYTADPIKRRDEWRANAKAGMPDRGWRREYEIDWTAPEGEPVVPEFLPAKHVHPLTWLRGLRPLRGWDPGFVSPAVILAQLSPAGQLRIYAELVPFNTPLESLIPMVKAVTMELCVEPLVPFDAGDPHTDRETDLGNVAAVLQKHGIFLHMQHHSLDVSYESFRKRFREDLYVAGEGLVPSIIIDPRCRTLISALGGAFHLSMAAPYRPIRAHPYADIVDATRYLHDNLAATNQEYQRELSKMARVDWSW